MTTRSHCLVANSSHLICRAFHLAKRPHKGSRGIVHAGIHSPISPGTAQHVLEFLGFYNRHNSFLGHLLGSWVDSGVMLWVWFPLLIERERKTKKDKGSLPIKVFGILDSIIGLVHGWTGLGDS